MLKKGISRNVWLLWGLAVTRNDFDWIPGLRGSPLIKNTSERTSLAYFSLNCLTARAGSRPCLTTSHSARW